MSERYYLVTFDLRNSANRTSEYAMIARALQDLVGEENYFRTIKQLVIVKTTIPARRIRDFMAQRLGGDCDILVVRLARGYAFKLMKPEHRQIVSDALGAIPA